MADGELLPGLFAFPGGDDQEGQNASAGHALGQLVGDWFQDYFAQPLLLQVVERLGLYLDHRLRRRPARGAKILWRDEDGNAVDYDFVLELNGTDVQLGVPVAFLECFWRRGSRHSKDKARDDSGKLMPMRETYPTARFLGIVASGDFTGPARTLVQSRGIDLFLVTKQKMIDAFRHHGIVIDYPDRLPEKDKAELAERAKNRLTEPIKQDIARELRQLISEPVLTGYTSRVLASLSALPQEIRILGQRVSAPRVFESVEDAHNFLHHQPLQFEYSAREVHYTYEVTYSDGFEFTRQLEDLEALRRLNDDIKLLHDHVQSLTA